MEDSDYFLSPQSLFSPAPLLDGMLASYAPHTPLIPIIITYLKTRLTVSLRTRSPYIMNPPSPTSLGLTRTSFTRSPRKVKPHKNQTCQQLTTAASYRPKRAPCSLALSLQLAVLIREKSSRSSLVTHTRTPGLGTTITLSLIPPALSNPSSLPFTLTFSYLSPIPSHQCTRSSFNTSVAPLAL